MALRTRIAAVVVLTAWAAGMAVPAWGGPPATATTASPSNAGGFISKNNNKDPAAQEARARAYAQLYKSLEELQVTPEQRVGEFLSSGADRRARVYEAVRRAVRATSAQVYSDGVTAVQVELPVREAVRALAEACRAENGAVGFQPEDFDKIVLYTDRESLWGFGSAKEPVEAVLGSGGPAGWSDLGVFGRLKVRHEATENGYRQILERVRGLRISPTRTVGEFLGSDQRIAADIEVFIRAHPAGEARYLPERICEVDVSLPQAALTGELKSLANAYEVAAFPAAGFNEVSLNAAGPVLEVTGVAVPQPAARTTEPAGTVVALWTRTAEAELPEAVVDAQQGRLLAARAALAVAREEIREEIYKEPLGQGTAGAAVDENPALRKDIDTFLLNVREVKVRNLKGNRVEVTAEIEPGRMQEVLEFYRQKTAK
jgi:hypothetical protein